MKRRIVQDRRKTAGKYYHPRQRHCQAGIIRRIRFQLFRQRILVTTDTLLLLYHWSALVEVRMRSRQDGYPTQATILQKIAEKDPTFPAR